MFNKKLFQRKCVLKHFMICILMYVFMYQSLWDIVEIELGPQIILDILVSM